MIGKLLKYTLAAVALCVVICLLCSEKVQTEFGILTATISGSTVDKLERQLDQGELSLKRYDEAFQQKRRHLATLKASVRDMQDNIRNGERRAAELRAAGNEEAAASNERQVAMYRSQINTWESTIQTKSDELLKLRGKRELAREEVRLGRERIAILKSLKTALSEEETDKMVEQAEANIKNVEQYSNQLQAEVDVINISD